MTGAPGSGESNSAQLVARQYGRLYYDSDCFGELRNRARLTEGHWTGTWIVNNIILNQCYKCYMLHIVKQNIVTL